MLTEVQQTLKTQKLLLANKISWSIPPVHMGQIIKKGSDVLLK